MTGPSRFDRPRAGDRALHALGVAGMSMWSMRAHEDGVDYGLRRGDAAGLARALDAEGLDRRRLLGERHV